MAEETEKKEIEKEEIKVQEETKESETEQKTEIGKTKKEKPKNKVKTHVSEAKKEKVKELADLMKKKTVMVVSIKGLPSAQFQDIKKKLRGKAVIQVAKKSLVDFALDHSGIKELHGLIPYVQENSAILFSDNDAFEISGILASEKSPAKAKEGQESPEEIVVSAGPTDLLPGPDISALSAVGLQPKVEQGKIHIVKDSVLVKKGENINSNQASIMAKLDIVPFKVGIEPVAAYTEGKVYADIKIDKEGFLEELKDAYSRGLAFSVEIGYVCKDNLSFVLGRAAAHEGALSGLIKEEKKDDADLSGDVGEVPKADELAEKAKEKEEAGEEKKDDAQESKTGEDKK
ncbi:50S ribosomal protein L10 [Candidatus Pacearchaeota archaeon]|nr:50S ribosomal protein L10 [Candidatus Pacearchaeota archaeon]|tara:strand:- start:284 stop:1318 length:1035 start_codon:yes stop_codon:yes gene_type:complete